MPCDGKLKIENSTLTGYTGLEACAGTIDVVNTTINATGNKFYSYDEMVKQGSFWSDGSAVLIRAQKGYANGKDIILNIDENSSLSSVNGSVIRICEHKGNTETVHGVNNITVNYYSANSSWNEKLDKVVIEKLEKPLTTIKVNDLSEAVTE